MGPARPDVTIGLGGVVRRGAMKWQVLVILGFALAAGSGCDAAPSWPERCDLTVRGICVANYAQDASLADAEAEERLGRLIDHALEFWGGAPGALQGWAMIYYDHKVSCGDDGQTHDGCEWSSARIMEARIAKPGCFEYALTIHEIGHAVIGDTNHTDPRWRIAADFQYMGEAISEGSASPGCDDDG